MLAVPRFDDGAIDMQDLLRRLAEQVANAVMDAEADQLCGSGANSRNGQRERLLATCVGTLTPSVFSTVFTTKSLCHCAATPRQLIRRSQTRSAPRYAVVNLRKKYCVTSTPNST